MGEKKPAWRCIARQVYRPRRAQASPLLEGDGRGSLSGSSSGTTGLGSERSPDTSSGPGGIEGVSDEQSPSPDEDRSRR